MTKIQKDKGSHKVNTIRINMLKNMKEREISKTTNIRTPFDGKGNLSFDEIWRLAIEETPPF